MPTLNRNDFNGLRVTQMYTVSMRSRHLSTFGYILWENVSSSDELFEGPLEAYPRPVTTLHSVEPDVVEVEPHGASHTDENVLMRFTRVRGAARGEHEIDGGRTPRIM